MARSRFATACPLKTPTVVKRLHDAGAVLVAKLSLGALALNDIWFGGQTMNPWLLEEGFVRLERGARRRRRCRIGRIRHRQRDRREHRQPVDALRHHRPAADLWTRCPHWRDDPLLVARQTWPHDAQRGRCHAGAACDHRPRCGRRGQRAQPSGFRCGRQCRRAARRILPEVDERESRHCRRPRRRRRSEERLAWFRSRCRFPTGPTTRST